MPSRRTIRCAPSISLRGWFAMMTFAAAWCGLAAAFPQNALQVLDLWWHLAYDATWRGRWSFLPTWPTTIGLGLLLFSVVGHWRGSRIASCWFLLGWAVCGAALVRAWVNSGWASCCRGPYRVELQAWWLYAIACEFLPVVICSLPALSSGIWTVARQDRLERCLMWFWLVIAGNLAMLMALGMLLQNCCPVDDIPDRTHSLLYHGELFAPAPPPFEFDDDEFAEDG